jgi:capsid protein
VLSRILNWWSPKVVRGREPSVQPIKLAVRARYDAAVTTDDNRRHWASADGLSPNASNSAEVRRILRNRARYETANNSYARGIVLTLAHDVVGTGPRLQMLTGDSEANRRIEQAFMLWARSVHLSPTWFVSGTASKRNLKPILPTLLRRD